MEHVKVNEGSVFAHPEVIGGKSDWVYTEEPDQPITVSANGLKELLQIVAACWPVAAGAAFSIAGKAVADGPYANELTHKKLAPLLNRISAVWCEGDLIVSGLFLDEQGRVVMNTVD